jgi:hypothetical protein
METTGTATAARLADSVSRSVLVTPFRHSLFVTGIPSRVFCE